MADKIKRFNWIALQREIITHKVFYDPRLFQLWVWLIAKAAFIEHYESRNEKPILIQRGQLAITVEEISQTLGISVSSVRRYLELLKGVKYDYMISIERKSKCMIITVKNYGKYQH